jgi:hypothetical protein
VETIEPIDATAQDSMFWPAEMTVQSTEWRKWNKTNKLCCIWHIIAVTLLKDRRGYC